MITVVYDAAIVRVKLNKRLKDKCVSSLRHRCKERDL